MVQSLLQRVVHLAHKTGVLRPRDLDSHRIARQYLRLAQERGLIQQVGRGLYVATDIEPTEHHSLAQAAARVPHGIVCLLSALRYHEITTQARFEVWLALDEKARRPKVDAPPLRIVRFSGRMRTYGVQTVVIENVRVHLYNPAKTVADCFRYRNKIGLDVALEALRDALRRRKVTTDQLWEAAKVCRVGKVIRPYLEAVV
jgi:predicted transcriptional regulator of viral defense system